MLTSRQMFSDPVLRLRDELDRMFGSFGPHGVPAPGRAEGPALNMWEDESSLFVEAELPGVAMEDLEVVVLGDELTIRGKRTETRRENVITHRRERGEVSFTRSVRLPFEIDPDNVGAELSRGVLTITLPKAPEARPRRIEVRRAES